MHWINLTVHKIMRTNFKNEKSGQLSPILITDTVYVIYWIMMCKSFVRVEKR